MDSQNMSQDQYSLTVSLCPWSTPRWSYDVYLNSTGEGTPKSFTDHLYQALDRAGIHVFRDDDHELPPRDHDISFESLKPIQESKFSVVVFSKDYASSRCLDKLVEIIRCKKSTGQLVVPVFYDVDPRDIRKQTGSFEADFARHEESFNPERVKEWRDALTEAANLAGWHFENCESRSESNFIENIVKEIVQRIKRKLVVAKYPVGLDSPVEYLKARVGIFGTDDVGVVGLYGMGGIGKTTVAKEFYNSAIHHYEASCFLENVREESKQNGLVSLQKKLLYELIGKNYKVANVDQGINLIKERLGRRRVLVVLDDLDELRQFDSLTGHPSWFGKGSLIMVTTRDKHLLDQAKVDIAYEVEELNDEDSLTLFSWHAFERPVPLQDYRSLLKDFLHYTGRVPLVLEILGSSLFKKASDEWKNVLEELKRFPPAQIQAKLRTSFDTLDDTEKDIFLDIACFFNGMEKESAIKIFDACGFFGTIGISTLIDRCLLKVDRDNRIRMHDLLQDMGREIVREKFPEDPGKHTRLWLQDDICTVLKDNKGTDVIEGIMLDMPMQLRFSTRPFARMRNLRVLQINNVNLKGSFKGLFKELRWLSWHNCPLKHLPSDLHLDELISLDMQKSNLRMLWQQTKFLRNLTNLNLSQSESLKTTLNFTGVPNLEELRLGGCKSLSHIHDSIGNLDKLIMLDLEECKNIKSLPSSICHLKSLEELNLGKCSRLKQLPEDLGSMKCLRRLDASNSGVKRLPHSIGLLDQLEELTLNGCKKLRRLPGSICDLKSVDYLYLMDCSNLEELPEKLGDWKALKGIYASGTGIKQLPDSIGNLDQVIRLSFTDCKSLKSLPSSICKLKSLKNLYLTNCSDLEQLPEQLGDMTGLEDLNVSGTGIRNIPESIQVIPYLHTLLLNDCKQLKSLPIRTQGFSFIRLLALRNCNLSDGDIPDDFWELSSLMILDLSGNNFSCLPSGIGELSSLQVLYASECKSLLKLPHLSNLEILRNIVLMDCNRLIEIPGLENLHSLQEIYLNGCSIMPTTIENLLHQGYLRNLSDCKFYFSRRDMPDWFEYQGTEGSSIYFDVPLDVQDGSFHLTVWVDYLLSRSCEKFISIGVHIDNKTSGDKWACDILGKSIEVSSCMILGPPVRSGDSIEVSFELDEGKGVKVEKCGVHASYIKKARETDCSHDPDEHVDDVQ